MLIVEQHTKYLYAPNFTFDNNTAVAADFGKYHLDGFVIKAVAVTNVDQPNDALIQILQILQRRAVTTLAKMLEELDTEDFLGLEVVVATTEQSYLFSRGRVECFHHRPIVIGRYSKLLNFLYVKLSFKADVAITLSNLLTEGNPVTTTTRIFPAKGMLHPDTQTNPVNWLKALGSLLWRMLWYPFRNSVLN